MATPLERVLDNDLNLASNRLGDRAKEAHQRLTDHDEKVERMPWYERAFTYLERRQERAQLVHALDFAMIRVETTHDLTEVVHETIKQHTLAVEREGRGPRQPERTVERERRSRSRADDFEREL